MNLFKRLLKPQQRHPLPVAQAPDVPATPADRAQGVESAAAAALICDRFYEYLFPDGRHRDRPLPDEQQTMAMVEDELGQEQDFYRRLPRFPSVLPRLMRELNSDDASIVSLAGLVQKEPTLTVQVLRWANSPVYRQAAGPAESVDQAVRVLGINGLKLAVAESVMRPLIRESRNATDQFSARILHHSLQTATAAQYLAIQAGLGPFDAYLCGITHELGRIHLFQRLNACFDRVCPAQAPRSTLFFEPLRRLSTRTGARIVRHLEFPDSLVRAVEDQEIVRQADAARDLGQNLFVANAASEVYLLGEAGLIEPEQGADYLGALGVPGDEVQPLMHVCARSRNELA